MGDAILSPLIDAVIGELVSPLLDEVRTMWQVDDDLDSLSDMLSAIQCVLADAEERQIRDRSVKKWLGDLKDVAYDAEDVMDELAYEALRQKAEGETSNGKRRKVSIFHTWFSLFRSKPVSVRLDIKRKIRVINEKIDNITKNRERFCLRGGDGGRPTMKHMLQRPLTSSLMAVEVEGRAKEKEEIINLLMADDVSRRKHASVISIVGMGGLGKTTLAQLVYNDENVKKHFEVRAWVCVSQDFDIPRLTREIIESAAPQERCNWSAMDSLQCKLEQILSGKRYLIVLDDLWSEMYEDWEKLLAPFNAGAQGSKILVTTQLQAAPRAMAMATHHLYKLRPLAYDDCLSLFLQHAFPGENYDAYPELLKIGKELVSQRCQGLPLAAKALGGLLRDAREESCWKSILKSEWWNSPNTKILPALSMSYHHLPPEIKQCFAFCSIFPKDHSFDKDTLVRLWMAHGFIAPKLEGRSVEDIGQDYFDCLLSRSFFQHNSQADCSSRSIFAMHNCIHDLAESVSADECFRFKEGESTTRMPKRGPRHLSVILKPTGEMVNLEAFYDYKGLRTFSIQSYVQSVERQALSDLLVKLKCLRVLDLSLVNIEELPDSICNLVHLRYLDLSRTRIRQLPEVVGSLHHLQTLNLSHCRSLSQLPEVVSTFYHLQTLNLSYCSSLCQLPEVVSSLSHLQTLNLSYCSSLCHLPKETSKLLSLRHLNLEGCHSLKTTPTNMGRLMHLQTLSKFAVGRRRGCGIGELKELRKLKGAIHILNLQNVEIAEEAKEVSLKGIERLTLEWDGEDVTVNSQDEGSIEQMEKILDALQPSSAVKCLEIVGYGGVHFPSWLRGEMFPKLVSFALRDCRRCESLPNLGQLNMLKDITIHGMNGIKRIDEIKGFPLLESLQISNMDNLEEWWCESGNGEIFPHLTKLEIINCPKLVKTPGSFSNMKSLSLKDCLVLSSLPKSACIGYLSLRNCKESLLRKVLLLRSLSHLTIEGFKETSLPEGLLQDFTNLETLEIIGCDNLVSLVHEERLQEKGLSSPIQFLTIGHCPKLRSLPKELQDLTHLRHLTIDSCPQLSSLPKGLETLTFCLTITNCPQLNALPELFPESFPQQLQNRRLNGETIWMRPTK